MHKSRQVRYAVVVGVMHRNGKFSHMLYELALATLENVDNKIASSFRNDFPELNQLSSVDLKPSILPLAPSVLKVGNTASSTTSIVQEIQETYQSQQWRQPYQADDFGLDFINKTAWFPIADVEGPILYSKGLMEIMLLEPNITYPNHKHSPEELYVVLAGHVWWQSDNQKACRKFAGEVIHHLPNVIHSIKAGNKPVLILNLWRGGSFEMPVITNA